MVVIRTLKHHDFRTTIPPIHGNVQWSSDNQVALINRKGIVIFEITADPCTDSDDPFSCVRSCITTPTAVPRVDCGFSPDSLFSQRTKSQLYELMLDRILTPRGLAGIEYNNHYVRVDWSFNPIDSAFPHFKPHCLLAALTSNFQLKIYDTKERQGYYDFGKLTKSGGIRAANGQRKGPEDDGDEQLDDDEISYHDGWIPILDLTKIYNQILVKEWTASDGEFQHCRFASYKDRLYQLAIVEFGWIEPRPIRGRTGKSERVSNLMTFHANGDLIIWRTAVQGDRSLRADIALRTTLVKNQIVSAHKYVQISSSLGILAVGFNSGHVKVYRIDFNTESTAQCEYLIQLEEDDGGVATVWSDMDQLQIKFLDFVLDDDETTVAGQAPVLTLVAIKHPSHILSFKLHILPERIIWEEMSAIESSSGAIVSMSKHSPGVFMLNHENGALGFLEIQNSEADYFPESSTWIDVDPEEEEEEDNTGEGGDDDNVDEGDYLDSHKIHSKDPNYASLWIYHGFALSPNGTLALSSKALRKTHDSILIKEAAACTFLSILPDENAWPYVKEKYEEANFSIQKIVDVLHAFRYQLRVNRDYILVTYREGKCLEDMTIPELKLYLWTIKAMGLPKAWNSTGKAYLSMEDITHITINVLRETALTQEALLEKYLTSVMEKVFSNESTQHHFLQSTKNLQSASSILQYLRSKPMSSSVIPSEFQVPVEPPLPICSSCDKEISFEHNKAYDPLKGMTEPGIPGCKWTGQTCFDQHPNAVCILSLIPFDYPNRMCPYCGCAALMEPALEQQPFCPFCEEFLRSYPEAMDAGEEMEIEHQGSST